MTSDLIPVVGAVLGVAGLLGVAVHRRGWFDAETWRTLRHSIRTEHAHRQRARHRRAAGRKTDA